MGASGHQFEVQIRTEEMHRIAEEGIRRTGSTRRAAGW